MPTIKERKNIANLNFVAGSEATISGFLREFRNCGKLLFLKISDSTGEIQVLIKCQNLISTFNYKKESVLLIKGILQNKKSVTDEKFSDWEIVCSELEMLSEAKKEIPFQLNDLTKNISEDLRLQYRYLDLRRNNVKKHFYQRSLIKQEISSFLIKENFIEINTPALSISTQEGAKTFNTSLILNGHKHEFALSQSPQLYKQVLMISGFEKYFQFANVFRQEDLRKDRQYEFTQIDLELSYSNKEYLFSLIEKLFHQINKNVFKDSLKMSFTTITYEDAYQKYGCDKPDLRFGNEIIFLSKNDQWSAYAITINKTSKIELPESNQWAEFRLFDINIENKTYSGLPKVDEFLDSKQIEAIYKLKMLPTENLIVLITDNSHKKHNLNILSRLRTNIAEQNLNLDSNQMNFVWVVDWPLFEYNEVQKKHQIAHHLFTKPDHNEKIINIEKDKSLGYDLVLNGVEIASGSVRNNDSDVQLALFKAAGLSEKEIQDNFGWFLETLQYGVPPHLGIAIGFDRLLQILLNTESIRDVIAFPKNNHGFCKMTSSPKKID